MPKREDLKTILLIGSGPIVIGQACEFDYSGSQAVKALKEEGYRVVLVNSNPATIMTDQRLADRTYIEPITPEFAERIIAKERPEAVLPTIGGQTALNLTIELAERGIFEKYNVEVIGANVEAIKKAEDRDSFKVAATNCGLESAKSFVVNSEEEGQQVAKKLGFPIIIRPSRTLGGSGAGIAENQEEFTEKLAWGLSCSPINEVLLEESLLGWKEIELEVMRDRKDNAVVICSIENLDPMGVHTGDSVTVAPVQTLTDKEYQLLRTGSLNLLREIGVDTGGSNVQFAICPETGRQVVIEMNPRVSRSSALASKATGFPIAKIAAKLAVGYTLDELPNDITKKTPSSFEPSIDYVVVKIPRFTFEKFGAADDTLGTQMKSVGEAMAIGRTFAESLQKACRSLETDRRGLLDGPESAEDDLEVLKKKIVRLSPARMYQAARALELGASPEEINEITGFDIWFLSEMKKIVEVEKELRSNKLESMDDDLLLRAKRLGTSDARLSQLLKISEDQVFADRVRRNIRPAFKTVDTCAAEFASSTPYLYSTYEKESDAPPSDRKKVIILGCGPNRIGQGLEFDYCCVHAAFALRELGLESIMVNCNPETVSTDYDTSDRLYFEPLTVEDVFEIVEREKPWGAIIQYGGQTPLRLSLALKARGVPIIGTSPEAIELSEDREQFKSLLEQLELKQAESGLARNKEEALAVASEIGFPLMVRPSFVLGGRAMAIIHNEEELGNYIEESVEVSFERPVLLDRFLDNAIELDVDAVCDGEDVVIAGISEHIERAGIHSGDSSFMLPSQTIADQTILEIEAATKKLAQAVGVSGLMNVQFAVCEREVYVLEVNPRASRSIPFVSKVTGIPWAKVAARVMAGEKLRDIDASTSYGHVMSFSDYSSAVADFPFVAVKQSVFPFTKFPGVDTVLGPEMRSTGEVMGFDVSVAGSFLRAQHAVGRSLPKSGTVFFSVKDGDKEAAFAVASKLVDLGFDILATRGTAAFFNKHGLKAEVINKMSEGSPHIVDKLDSEGVAMVINTPEGTGPLLDSRTIRSTATARSIPLFTTIAAATAAAEAVESMQEDDLLRVRSVQEYTDEVHKILSARREEELSDSVKTANGGA